MYEKPEMEKNIFIVALSVKVVSDLPVYNYIDI